MRVIERIDAASELSSNSALAISKQPEHFEVWEKPVIVLVQIAVRQQKEPIKAFLEDTAPMK
jgi:hypothetical protein